MLSMSPHCETGAERLLSAAFIIRSSCGRGVAGCHLGLRLGRCYGNRKLTRTVLLDTETLVTEIAPAEPIFM